MLHFAKHIFLFLVSLVPIFVLANESKDSCHFQLKGRIVEETGSTQIPFVGVYLEPNNIFIESDSDGNFIFNNLCKNTYIITLKQVGFQNLQKTILIEENLDIPFTLKEGKIVKQEADIHAHKSENQLIAKVLLNEIDLFKTSGNDLATQLSKIPGISMLSNGPTINKPMINGLTGNRVLFYNDGIRLEGQQWGSEHSPEIDPYLASSIEIIKGSSALKYASDAIGGIIFTQAKPILEKKGILAIFNSAYFSNNRQLSENLQLEGLHFIKKHEIAWNTNATFKKAGNSHAPGYYLSNTGFEQYNFNLGLHYHFDKFKTDIKYSQFNSKIGIYFGSHIGNLADLINAISKQEPSIKGNFSLDIARPYQKVNHEQFSITSQYDLNNYHSIIYKFSRQFNERGEFDILRNSKDNISSPIPQVTFRLTTFANDLYWENNPKNLKWKFQAGINQIKQLNTMGGYPLIPNFESNAYGLYYISSYKKENNSVEIGLRYDFKQLVTYRNSGGIISKSTQQFSSPTFNIGYGHYFNPSYSFKSNIRTSFRPPHVSELYISGLHHGTGTYEKGDANLKPETSLKWINTLSINKFSHQINIDVFGQYINQFIVLFPKFPPIATSRGAFPLFQYAATDALLTGIDFSLQKNLDSTNKVTLKSSYLYSYDLKEKQFLINTPPLFMEISFTKSFKKFHRIKSSNLEMSCLAKARQFQVNQAQDYSPSPNAYFLFGASYNSNISFQKREIWIGLEIKNIFNTTYRDYLDKFRYFGDAQGINFQLRVKVPIKII